MSHKMHSGEMTPAEALATAREFEDNVEAEGRDTSYDAGRAIVREFIDTLEPGAVVSVRSRRVLVEVGQRRARTPADMGDTQAVGRTLAAHARGNTPDEYLPHVTVEEWREVTDGGPTTWTIEVGDDA